MRTPHSLSISTWRNTSDMESNQTLSRRSRSPICVDVEPFGLLAEQAVLKAGFHQPFGNLALKIHRELPPVSATASWIRSRSKMNLIL